MSNGPAKKFGTHPRGVAATNCNTTTTPEPPPAEPEVDDDDETEVCGLPPDLQILGAARKRSQYWHLPTNVWDKIGKEATGKGVVIANLDTGYNPKHPFSPKPIAARSFVPGERDAVDLNGHGSHTVGTCCGRSPTISPAPEADLIVAKVLGARGQGDSNAIARAIRWATDEPNTGGHPVRQF